MSRIESALADINRTTSAMKVCRVMEEHGVSEDKVLEVIQVAQPTFQKVGETLRERLDNFRQYVGPEQYAVLANSPALENLMAEWQSEVKTKNGDVLAGAILALFPEGHELTATDIKCFLAVSLGA
jgi:hypothetical protein